MEKKIWNMVWILVALVAVMATISVVMAVLFRGYYYNGTYGPFNMPVNGYARIGIAIMMPIMAIITIIFVVIFVRFLFANMRGAYMERHGMWSNNAENIAKERLAKGEITEEQYEKIIETLRK
jgi:putative membrane protein